MRRGWWSSAGGAEAAPVGLRLGPVSLRINLRVLSFSLLALLGVVALGAWATTLGSFPISVPDVLRSVIGMGSEEHDFIVRTLRLPRVLTAILVGCCLAMAGGVFQGLVRNPLVSPDIIGINAGATTLAVAWIVTGQNPALLPFMALAGAVSAAVLIYALSWRSGISGVRLILVGIGINAAFSALTTFLLVRYPVEIVASAVHWQTGSVYGAAWGDVIVLAVVVGILAPVTIALMWPLRILQFGDESASSLGVNVEPTRLALLGVGCAFAAAAVSVAGPIGFVALMTPHIARMIAGPMTGGVMLLSGLIGAIVLLGSDVIAQHALPVSLPVGVITAAVGAPYFLFLLYRTQTRL